MRETIAGSEVGGNGSDAGAAAPAAGKGKTLQRRGGDAGGEAPAAIEEHIASTRGGGDRLSGGVLQKMNSAFGQDFGGVGIHTDAASADACRTMGAQAFTVGSDVYFDQGKFDPGSHSGQELIGHELTHVVQQGGGQASGVQTKLAVGAPGDAHEQQADAMGAKAANAPDPGAPGGAGGPGAQDPNKRPKVFGKGQAQGADIAADETRLRRKPADVSFGTVDHSIVSIPPSLVQSHIAQDVNVASRNCSDRWIWHSRWIVYDANDKVIDEEGHWKYPDYTLKPDTVKKGTPSDGGSNPWTVRFEVTETGKPWGGDNPDNFPWDESRFHVYASPIANPLFSAKEERGSQIVASDSFTPAEDGGSYSMKLSGTSSRTDSGSETITTSVKMSGERESSLGITVDGVTGGLKDKVGFEAQKSIAKTTGVSLQTSQTIERQFSQPNLKKGTNYQFTVYPKFMVLTGSANVLNQNMGIVSGVPTPAAGSIRIWTGYEFVAQGQ